MWADVLYTLRSLVRQPLFYSVVVLTLAIGIGANAAIFTVVNAVLLQPLPYPDPDRLMMVWTYNPRQGFDKDVGTYPNFEDWRRGNQSFERMSGYFGASVTLTGSGDPEQIRGVRVTHEFFDTIQVQPALGRSFGPEHGRAGGERVVLLAHGLWTRRFGADPGIVGRQITLNGVSHEVLGVMPSSFTESADAQFWLPLAPVGQFASLFTSRGSFWLTVVGRLKSGVTQAAAQAEMDAIAARLEKEYPSNAGLGIRLVRLHEEIVGDVKRPLLILLAAVCFVLLIACANVANLLLTRAASRTRELAIRAALGAGRARLSRQLLTESLVLGLIGGIAGLALAMWATGVLRSLAPAELPRLDNVSVDAWVLAYTAGAALLTSLLFGIVPAIHASRHDVGARLKEGGRTGTDGRSGRLRTALAISELAIALVLLVGASLLVRSFIALSREDPGFANDGVLTLRLQLPAAKYGEPARVTAFHEQLIERLGALPGVASAAAGSTLLLSQLPNSASINIEGRPPVPSDVQNLPVPYDSVSPEFFTTLQIPLRRGRFFSHADGPDSQGVAIVNEAFVRRFFPGEEPLGRRVTFGTPGGADTRWQTIVGVVADTKRGGFGRAPWAEIYFPMRQAPDPRVFMFVRTTGDPMALAAAAQAAVWSIDRDQAIAGIRTVRQLLAQREANRWFTTLLLGLFAAVALVLAVIGIYGVIAYATAQRTQEIGIRLALGADQRSVLRLVLAGGLRIAAIGLALGLAGALALTRVLSGLLFGVGARDPVTFVGVPIVLLFVVLAACWVPARRAMRIDPLIALRAE
jgi:putative ABC transport system permease protein